MEHFFKVPDAEAGERLIAKLKEVGFGAYFDGPNHHTIEAYEDQPAEDWWAIMVTEEPVDPNDTTDLAGIADDLGCFYDGTETIG